MFVSPGFCFTSGRGLLLPLDENSGRPCWLSGPCSVRAGPTASASHAAQLHISKSNIQSSTVARTLHLVSGARHVQASLLSERVMSCFSFLPQFLPVRVGGVGPDATSLTGVSTSGWLPAAGRHFHALPRVAAVGSLGHCAPDCRLVTGCGPDASTGTCVPIVT